MKTRYFDLPEPRLYGHRGAAAHYPENTLPSFAAALAAGVPYLELDVWASSDGHVMVHHDETAERLCGDPRAIAECTLAELKELDPGFAFSKDGGLTRPFAGQGICIPTLEELFEAFPGALFNIEIKQGHPSIEELTIETIRRAEMEEAVLLAAEKDEVMAGIRRRCGGIPTSLCRRELEEFFAWVATGGAGSYSPPGRALQIPNAHGGMSLVTPETIAAAHSVGLEMHVWTINERAEMERLLDLGVDGIMTDYPEILVETAKNKF